MASPESFQAGRGASHRQPDVRIAGVAFTGSTATAKKIARTLVADDDRPIVPLIAETGGINAMIVDSTALPEQVVIDVVTSAFRSAGQRCSALRLLCLQEDIAGPMLAMIAGAARELKLGDPADPSVQVGPVIDAVMVTKCTDGLLVVVRENHCPGYVLNDCVEQLRYAKANILGFVMNGCVEGAGKRYQYGKQYAYRYEK